MKMQFVLRTGLAIVEAQVLLGITEGKLDLETGAVEGCRHPLRVGDVEEHPLLRLRVGPAGQDVHDLQPAQPGLAVQFDVVQVDLFLLQGCAGHAPQVTAIEATVELPLVVRPPRVGAGVAEAQDTSLRGRPAVSSAR